MDTNHLFNELQKYIKGGFHYEELVIDLANNPFFAISFIGDERCITHGAYLTPNHSAHSSQYSTPTNFALCSVMQAAYLNGIEGEVKPVTTEYGFCNSLKIEGIIVIIAIIANQNDVQFIYTTLKNKIEIICANVQDQ